MHTLLAIAVIGFCLFLLTRAIRDAQANSWAGPRTPAMRSRAAAPRLRPASRGRAVLRSAGAAAGSAASVVAHPSNSAYRAQAKADGHRLWQEAAATNWLEERRHERANGTAPPSTATAVKPTLRQQLKVGPFKPDPANPASGGNANGNGTSGTSSTGGTNGSSNRNGAGPQAPPAPANPAPAPTAAAPPASTNGGTSVPGTSSASAEKLVEGIQEIYARAASGGITAKQEAVRAAREGAIRFAGMMQMLARTMAEPGSNYGPEVTEPISKAGTQFQAGAMLLSEADNALETLANMTLREASTSPRQVPHHQNELSESGAH